MKAKIIRSARRTLSLKIENGMVTVHAPRTCPDREIERFLAGHQQWIRTHLEQAQREERQAREQGYLTQEQIRELHRQARKVIPERVRHYAPLIGVTYGRITIRHQSSRWGSCSAQGNLNFNCLLMLAPSGVLDSVVVHELCHLKEMNHSKRFYAEVLRVFPEYYRYHGWLKENGGVLIRRMHKTGT